MDFERARFNMIEQQVRPWDVLEQSVLDILQIVPRELFVPATQRNLAFTDTEIALRPGGFSRGEVILPPKLDAKICQALRLKKSDRVLEIGTGSGYMAALLAKLGGHVTSYEIDAQVAEQARTNLASAGFHSLEVITGDASQAELGTFDAIVFSGSVGTVEEKWLNRLESGGRLAAYVGNAPIMQARLYERGQDGPAFQNVLFETLVPRLRGFAEPKRFVF